jgi:hypothetical protein
MRTHRTLIVGGITVLGLTAIANWPSATLADSDTHKDGAIPDLRLLDPSVFPCFRIAAIGSGPGAEQVAPEAGF